MDNVKPAARSQRGKHGIEQPSVHGLIRRHLKPGKPKIHQPFFGKFCECVLQRAVDVAPDGDPGQIGSDSQCNEMGRCDQDIRTILKQGRNFQRAVPRLLIEQGSASFSADQKGSEIGKTDTCCRKF